MRAKEFITEDLSTVEDRKVVGEHIAEKCSQWPDFIRAQLALKAWRDNKIPRAYYQLTYK